MYMHGGLGCDYHVIYPIVFKMKYTINDFRNEVTSWGIPSQELDANTGMGSVDPIK